MIDYPDIVPSRLGSVLDEDNRVSVVYRQSQEF